MESATLFVVGAVRKVRVGTVLTVFGNQTRREMGLSDELCFDTDTAVQVAVDALRILIRQDREQEQPDQL
jgi:uridine phosphorylase